MHNRLHSILMIDNLHTWHTKKVGPPGRVNTPAAYWGRTPLTVKPPHRAEPGKGEDEGGHSHMQDESHKKMGGRKVRLRAPESPGRSDNVIVLNNSRMAIAQRRRLNSRALYGDLSALAVDMARLRSEMQTAYERLIFICSALDAED